MTDPIAPNLLAPSGQYLVGGRHKQSGRFVFPFPSGPEAADYDKLPLADEGTLWSFTVQRFRPKSPPYTGADDERSFKQFALGYVELPGQIIVETRIETDDPSRLKIGMKMRLAAVPFARAAGDAPLTYAFRPAA